MIFAIFFAFAGCQSKEMPVSVDAQTQNELSRINRLLTTSQPLQPNDFDSLKKIYEKYPKDAQVRNLYKSALIVRKDWTSLENFIKEIPENERSREDRINLARVYLRLGRHQDLIDFAKPLAEKDKTDVEFNSLLGFGYFYLGQTDEAAKYLDTVWGKILSEKRADEITTRGLIYFRQNNFPKAIEILEKSLEINPQNATATNALSRIYAAQNNPEKAEEFRKKTTELHEKTEESESMAMRRVNVYYDLQTAWNEKKYAEVIELAQKILPEADEKNKPALYQFIAESYKALGKPEEARSALLELEKLKK